MINIPEKVLNNIEEVKNVAPKLEYYRIKNVTFSGSDISGYTFFHCFFVNCTFDNLKAMVRNDKIIFIDCDFEDCKFKNINIDGRQDNIEFDISASLFRKCMFDTIAVRLNSYIHKTYFTSCTFYKVITSFSVSATDVYMNGDSVIDNCDFHELWFFNVNITKDVTIKNTINADVPQTLPEGEFIGYKKARTEEGYGGLYIYTGPVIVTLSIPSDAKRIISINGKCRCDKAYVISIEDPYGHPIKDGLPVVSMYSDNKVRYKIGETVACDVFDPDPIRECSGGIHFFRSKIEAVEF